MDVLKETWEADKKHSEMVVSYVLSVREKLNNGRVSGGKPQGGPTQTRTVV